MDKTTEKILELLKKSNTNAHQLEINANLANSSIQAWKSGRAKPSIDAIIKIAKYFNVSADYLLGTEPSDEERAKGVMAYYLTPDKEELLMLYEEIGGKLGAEAQKGLINYAKFLVDGAK